MSGKEMLQDAFLVVVLLFVACGFMWQGSYSAAELKYPVVEKGDFRGYPMTIILEE